MNVTEEMGRYFGYPRCCIASYDAIQRGHKKSIEQIFISVTTNTQFLPCPEHAREIVTGMRVIDSLISNRICPLPFPQEPEIEQIDEYLTLSS